MLLMTTVAATPQSTQLNLADHEIEFNDRSAPFQKDVLQSEKYNAFIHQLYRFDSDNLQKFDDLYKQHQY